ncbi:glycosyltransferase family 71 protein [Acidomyces richmondensis BFW]|nr:glycosyltransferase family 71 protein [Acidomyces richmondensis BFW]
MTIPHRTRSQVEEQLTQKYAAPKATRASDTRSTLDFIAENRIDQHLSPPSLPRDLRPLPETFAEPEQSTPAQEGNTVEDSEADVRSAINLIVSLTPDEIHARELLRPFEGTGETKLRDIGLRTRVFKKFFEAWESLHLFSKDGSLYRRDDVVHYLHQHQNSVVNLTESIHQYDAFRHFMTQFASLLFPWIMPYYPDHISLHASFYSGGRGIVLTAGDGQAPYLMTSISSFRLLGCTLPIEVLYLGEEDLGEDWRTELESLPGVVTRDLSQLINDEGWKLAGWAAKPFAILMSSFREVLFVDADALFFVNPEQLFEDDDYVRTGALFFKDRLIMPESKKRWLQKVFPSPVPKGVRESRFWTAESGHMQESGVVVVDKWKHFVALLLVTRMNGPDRDGDEETGEVGVYEMVHGDKETFWLGWELVGDSEYAFHQGDAGIMGTFYSLPTTPSPMQESGGEDFDPELQVNYQSSASSVSEPEQIGHDAPSSVNYTVCSPQLLHLDRDSRPLWFNGWILNNKFADEGQQESSTFEIYMKEPKTIGRSSAWNLEDSNVCCLTSNEYYTFSDREISVLDMITSTAKEVGALDKR